MDNTYIEINLDNISKNVNTLIKKHHNYEYYFGVITADAYGHGMIEVAKQIIKNGINYLVVSNLNEALTIRQHLKKIPILCLEPIHINDINKAIKNNITITISSYEFYKQAITNKPKDLKVHIEINTGLNLFGICDKTEIKDIIGSKLIDVEGIYTQLADANNIISSYFDEQINSFLNLTKDIDLSKIPIVHVYDSSAFLSHPKLKIANGVRLGICMYGINTIKHKKLDFELKPAFKLISKIIEINKVKSNNYMGYNNSFNVKNDMLIGIVPIGFRHGLTKENASRNVSINGIKYKILDAITMTTAPIYIDESIKIGDEVVILGDVIPLKEVSNYLNKTEYELLTSFSNSIPKIYTKT